MSSSRMRNESSSSSAVLLHDVLGASRLKQDTWHCWLPQPFRPVRVPPAPTFFAVRSASGCTGPPGTWGCPPKTQSSPPYNLPPRGAPLFFWNNTTVQQVPFRDPLPLHLKCTTGPPLQSTPWTLGTWIPGSPGPWDSLADWLALSHPWTTPRRHVPPVALRQRRLKLITRRLNPSSIPPPSPPPPDLPSLSCFAAGRDLCGSHGRQPPGLPSD